MALYNHVYVINYRDKPFGAALPLDIQNRLVCMSWYADHRVRYAKVMDELRALPVCKLADWCPRSTRRFKDTMLEVSVNWLHRLGKPQCAWCCLYRFDNESISLRVLDLTLKRARYLLPYVHFVEDNLQAYANVHLYTLTHVLVPMLKWLPPNMTAFDHQPIHRQLSFTDIHTTYMLLWESFKLVVKSEELQNPRVLADEHYSRQNLRALIVQMLEQQGNRAQEEHDE